MIPPTAAARRIRARVGRYLRGLLPGPTTFMRVAYRVPRQVVLVTASYGEARALWPVDWHMPVGFEPPRYALSIGSVGHGAGVLRRAGCFVVNIVPASWEETILAAGSTSGASCDKFEALRLPTERATFVQAPYLPGAIGRLECVVEDITELGDRLLVVATVVHTDDRGDAGPRLHHQWTG